MDQNLLTTIAMIGLMLVAFYLLILRPQRKRQAQQRETIESLTPGSRVLTSTGVYGTLVRIGEKQAVLELSPGHEMTVVKHAIVRAIQPGDEDLEMDSRIPDEDIDADFEDVDNDLEAGDAEAGDNDLDTVDNDLDTADNGNDSEAADKSESGDDSPWADRNDASGSRGTGV